VNSLVLYPLIIVVCGGVLALGLNALGSFTQPEVAAWNRIALRHGYARPERDRMSTLAQFVPGLRRLLGSFDIATMLIIAQRPLTVGQFWSRLLSKAGVVLAVAVALDIAVYATDQSWLVPLWMCFVVAVAVGALDWARLRRQAAAVRREADLALGDLLLLITSVSGGHGLPLEQAVSQLSATVRSRALASIVVDRGWNRLVPDTHDTTAELYDAIGDAFGIPNFRLLAAAARSVRVGMASEEVYTRLAKLVYERRLLDARLQGSRAKLLVIIPVALMILPLIALILIPTFGLILQAI
jgi:hypothetical protein